MPGSNALHHIDSLRAQVKQVDNLRNEMMQAFGEDVIPASLEEHYWLGVSAILTPPPTTTVPKPLKPELNVSDLGDLL
jgi:hypothetical protein